MEPAPPASARAERGEGQDEDGLSMPPSASMEEGEQQAVRTVSQGSAGGDPSQRTASSAALGLAGFSSRSSRGVTREGLLEQGVAPAEADVIMFQAHEDEVLQQHFVRWICVICTVTVLAIPVFLCLFIWLLVEFAEHQYTECGSPLHTYCVGAIVVFNVKMFNSLLIRFFCRWAPERGTDSTMPESPPARVKAYRMLLELFIFVWHCVGLAWASGDAADAERGLPPCQDAAPQLLSAVRVYAIFNIAVTLFLAINIIGIRRVLQIVYRNGLLSTTQAAPAGTLEKSTEPVGVAALEKHVQENPCCPICIEEYVVSEERAKDVLRVKGCGHIFHRECLKGWMNVNRTCPLCRVDLTGSPGAAGGSEADPCADAGGGAAASGAAAGGAAASSASASGPPAAAPPVVQAVVIGAQAGPSQAAAAGAGEGAGTEAAEPQAAPPGAAEPPGGGAS